MKLATLSSNGRDGELVVVSKQVDRWVRAAGAPKTMQQAIDNWDAVDLELQKVYDELNSNPDIGQVLEHENLLAPLPRAYQWCDGSAFLNHVELVRAARKAKMPEELYDDPLMYQGGSDTMLGCRMPITASDEAWGIDCEGEVCAVLDDVPMGVTPEQAEKHIILLSIVNDVSLRGLIPAELAKNFGFFHGKPPTAFAPVFATPDELGSAWKDAKIHLPLRVWINDKPLGQPNAGVDMNFSLAQLIAHAAKTRPLGAGTIVGSGTISNRDRSVGSCCLAEVRMIETIEQGKPSTPFMRFGDSVRLDMQDEAGNTIFGDIQQQVVQV